MDRFLVLGLSGEFRYLTASWEEEDEDAEEKETDILGNVSLTVNHTKRLSSEWYAGTGLYFRPDNLSNEYKDLRRYQGQLRLLGSSPQRLTRSRRCDAAFIF